jgi:hypothetical protein
LIPDKFKEFVSDAVKENQATYVMKRNMKVEATPEFVDMFKSSTLISSKSKCDKLYRKRWSLSQSCEKIEKKEEARNGEGRKGARNRENY